ncbi:DEAD/DEAH box helicase [Saccharothrix sp. NRRL B-16314]|uniref:DEAD/DEAH box helicase n=1 Tax=Saccharothrix sp. NRRL B-16314 TaxID=1463825 RepID=UPI00052746FD|nr:DEAD/DEAH box helicase [Saccharothrix sp. NRRL B-16314]
MNKTERQELRRLVDDSQQWSRRAAESQSRRKAVRNAARAAEQRLAARAVDVNRAGKTTWQVIPLDVEDKQAVALLHDRANLPKRSTDDRDLLKALTEDVPLVVGAVSRVLGVRRFFTGSARKQTAGEAASYLRDLHAAVLGTDGPARLDRLGTFDDPVDASEVALDALLDPALRFDLVSGRSDPGALVVDRSAFAGLPRALESIADALANEESYRAAAHKAGEEVRRAEVRRMLAGMPVDALKTATRDRLRLGPLVEAGIVTVLDVLRNAGSLQSLPGVGETSARRMVGAAQTLRKTTFDEMPVRIDIANRHPETTELLDRLADWDSSRRTRGAAADLERAAELAPLGRAVGRGTTHLLVIPTRKAPADGFLESVRIVIRRAGLLDGSSASAARDAGADPWDDFLARPADYFAMLSELGFITEDETSTHGDLPEEIVEAVRDQALSGEHLTASLRGYQSFAARFALVQRKVVIGDEMGLGKTVEAIAVLAHLRSAGETHFVVVCPAAVVTNWVREVGGKSRLRAHRVHGPDRERAARSWARDGGVAVTTFETLKWWEPALTRVRDLACVVVDEAHYIKNPAAHRSMRTGDLVARADRAILLTGTPLENRVEEFRTLVSYLRPDLTAHADDLSARTFRRRIAPAYLRRNQEDVLTELPELIEVDEWLPLSAAEASAYRAAVLQGNFMAMRQAAMRQGRRSEKLRRLVEIVQEAEANERRVIVFSYFREVLDLVARELPKPVFGPLNGSVPAAKRQEAIDRFSAARHGAVLVAQIEALGVGLNIQSASVVVICEPQLKPTTEAQAIARAHRMGQVRSVQVHRLLSEDSVDQRITELLARKRQLFDEFARVSDTADSSPEAVDLSEAELVREVLAAERKRFAERVSDHEG